MNVWIIQNWIIYRYKIHQWNRNFVIFTEKMPGFKKFVAYNFNEKMFITKNILLNKCMIPVRDKS